MVRVVRDDNRGKNSKERKTIYLFPTRSCGVICKDISMFKSSPMGVLTENIFARGHPYFGLMLTCGARNFTSLLLSRRF